MQLLTNKHNQPIKKYVFACFLFSLCFCRHIDVVRIPPKNEYCDRANPHAAVEAIKVGGVVVRAVCEVAVSLGQESIA